MELLTNKKILVTGATGGIGQAIVKLFLSHGANISISGSSKVKLQNLVEEFPGVSKIYPCDLNDNEATEEMIKNVINDMSGLDVLVCNAGIVRDNISLKMTIEDFKQVVNLNLISSFILNKAAIKTMIKGRFGRIINISSVIASMGNAGQANYAASKAGLEGMSRSLAKEVATRNVTINCVAPGFIETPMTEMMPDEIKEKIKSNIAMGKLGEPENVANAVLFLASDMANYITGETIHVNGGLYMA